MAKLNIPRQPIYTYEGGKAKHINPEQQLRRSIMACLLWENQFYEDGVEIADRIISLIKEVKPEKVAEMAIEAREKMKLRHIPLLLIRELARQNKFPISPTLTRIVQRADELAEFLALYWKNGKCPISAQVKKGLAEAFTKFNEYQLAKYNRDGAIRLRDVLFLCHAKPKDAEQDALWKRLINDGLTIPDTWEVALSVGKDKKETWERLIKENKLGGLAFLRNLRNMKEANVDESIIFSGLESMKVDRVLPFRFIAAARYAPQWEDKIEPIMLKCLEGHEKLFGKTVLLVDVSGSMDERLSAKSDMTRMDAAMGLAILAREICENVEIISFSTQAIQIPPRHGFALRDAISNSQRHSVTYLGQAVQAINKEIDYNRLIVITDEQAHDNIPDSKSKGYVINVASYKNGVGYGKWLHIDGWSEAVIDYIIEYEKQDNKGEENQCG